MEETIFTKIINREIPAEIIYEDEHTIVIPDRFPSMKGQLLVITKQPDPYLFSIEDERYLHLMEVTKRISRALDIAFETTRTCAVIEGFEVPHTHIRLYPCLKEELMWERREATDEELAEVAEHVRAALNKDHQKS